MPKKYSEEEKQEIISAYQLGRPLTDIRGKFGVAPSTIYRWVKDKKEYIAEENMLPMDIRNLLFQKERLEHILQIIRLSDLLAEAPLRRRLDILEDLHEGFEQYNVHELCEALGVSRGTFYNHIFEERIAQSTRKSNRFLWCRYSKSLMTANSGLAQKKFV